MNGKKLVVMIPAFNEEKTIAMVVSSMPRKVQGFKEVKVLVVDDGSSDGTAREARNAGADNILSFASNQGLGIAFKKGIEEALRMKADVIVNIDADGQFNAKDISKLVKPIVEGKADMVSCSRFKDKQLIPEMPWVKKFGNIIFTGTVNLLTGSNFADTQCGFRAYSREAALRLNLFGKFTYTQEVFLDLLYKGLKIEEVACNVKGERQGKSKIVGSWYGYGLKALTIIIRTVRDQKPLKFFGGIGLIVFAIGFFPALFVAARWILTGHTSPFANVIVISSFLMIVGFLLIVLALIADLFDRQRKLQEEILYKLKRQELEKSKK